MKYHYIEGPTVNFEYTKYLGNPNYPVLPPVLGMINPIIVNGKELSVSIDVICEQFRTKFDIDSNIALDELKRLTPDSTKAFLVYLGKNNHSSFDTSIGHLHKHFHPPMLDDVGQGNYLSNHRRTVTVVIPISVPDPVTENFCWTEFEFDFLSFWQPLHNFFGQSQWIADNLKIDESKTQKIKLPDSGQYLVLDFDSSHNLHWIENEQGSSNEYICLILDT
jgi:hypothetical protein